MALLGLCFFVAGCSDNKEALDTWSHADSGSYGAALSPDNRFLLTSEIDGFARIWDLDQNKVLYSVQHDEGGQSGILDADFSELSDIMVTVERQSLARWSVGSGRLTGYWKWPNLTSIAISANGRYALIGSSDKQAVYFDMVAGKMRYVFPHHEKITSVALSRDGRFALTGSDDWHASLWDLKTGKHIWSKNLTYKVSLVELSDDGNYALAGAFTGNAYIFSTDAEGTQISKLQDKRMTLVSADFSDDSQILATGRAAKAIDIWDVKTGELIENWKPKVKHLVKPDSATILDLNIGVNGKTLVSESATGIGQRWAIN